MANCVPTGQQAGLSLCHFQLRFGRQQVLNGIRQDMCARHQHHPWMYASLSSKNASHINFIKFQALCFEATESDAKKEFHLFKLQAVKQKTCSCNCPASVSCYSKLQTLELCCYKGSTTSVRYMVQLAMHWKKTSCHNTEPTELGNYTIDVQFGITCVQSVKASFAVQTFGILRRHMELAKVRWFSVNVLFTCLQNPSLRTHLNFLRIGLCYILVDLHYKGLPHILGLPKHVPKSDRKRTSSQRVVLALLR